MYEENSGVVGMETVDAGMILKVNYLLMILKELAQICNMLMKRFPQQESSLSQHSTMGMGAQKLLDVVWRHCVLTAVRIASPTKSFLLDSRHQNKEENRTYMSQGTKGTQDVSWRAEVDVGEFISGKDVEDPDLSPRGRSRNRIA